MSHFSVLVITKSPEEEAIVQALQPYHEFESTEVDDVHVQTIDITTEARAAYNASDAENFLQFCQEWFGISTATKDTIDITGEHKYGHVLIDSNGEVLAVYDRTNPKKRWDWWELGGRWNGELRVHGEPCNQCRVGELDEEIANTLTTFAILDHEGWFARGSMGWFGCVADEREDWDQRYREYMKNVQQHPELWMTIVDCHI